MQKKLIAIAFGAVLVVMAGCAKVPQQQVDTAKQSIEDARSAGAAEYAPDALRAAEDAQTALENEIKAQAERFAMMRSYDKTIELAGNVEQASAKAKSAAEAERQRVMQEATDAIAAVRASLDEVRTMLDNAPRGKGTQADLAVLRSDLDGVQQSLPEMEAAFASENYRDALAKAGAARQTVDTVRDEVMRATELAKQRSGARRG